MKASPKLNVNGVYTRNDLERLFSTSDATIKTDVFQPKGYNSIWLFITKNKTPDRTQYYGRLHGDDLFTDGQASGRTDNKLITHAQEGNEVLVFYRKNRGEYPHGAFKYSGVFEFVKRRGAKPSRFHFRRIVPGKKTQRRGLEFAHSISSIRRNLNAYNNQFQRHPLRALKIVRQTTYWVFDPDSGLFGPSKFLAYRNMDFERYEKALAGKLTGARFNGSLAKNNIESVLRAPFSPKSKTGALLASRIKDMIGEEKLPKFNTNQWKFARLPSRKQYWAAMANPNVYKITDALKVRTHGDWLIKRAHVRRGDRLFIWKAKGSEKDRGIVALAEVDTDPSRRIVPSDRFWVKKRPKKKELRAKIRYLVPPGLPLWVSQDRTGLLKGLSVARATGGGIFKVNPQTWHRVLGLIGGWPDGDEQDTRFDASNRGSTTKGSGQGFNVSQEDKEAIERFAVDLAKDYFREKGYNKIEEKGKPYDLLCRKGRTVLYVEVKGTQGLGQSVLLTRNEVLFARKNWPSMALYIVSGINVYGPKGKRRARGGTGRPIAPWAIDEGYLTPRNYEYRVPEGID